MKRIITILLLICLFCSTGCAKKPEEFSIRNGIKFGMTPEEVIAIEGEPHSTDDEDLYYYDIFSGLKTKLHYGIFENELWDVQFTIYPSVENSVSAAKNDYEIIEKELIKKLGKPDCTETYLWDKYATNESSEWDLPYKDGCIQIKHSVNYSTYNDEERYRFQTVSYILREESAEELIQVAKERTKSHNKI